MPVQIKANEATAAKRRVRWQIVQADGISPALLEAGGQPQVSVNDAAFTDTGVGVLVHVGDGRYYATLTQSVVATAGTWIETRYKSVNTAECPGDSALVVSFDPSSAFPTIYSPVDENGDIELVKGDDYTGALALPFTGEGGNWDVDFDGATPFIELCGLKYDGDVVSSVSPKSVEIPLTRAQTRGMSGVHEYKLKIRLANKEVHTLGIGEATIR